jgi:hypothetical protein
VIFDMDVGDDALFEFISVGEYDIDGGQIDLQRYNGTTPNLTMFIGALIFGVLVPNRQARGCNIGWGMVWI